jgi:hypothetical protein
VIKVSVDKVSLNRITKKLTRMETTAYSQTQDALSKTATVVETEAKLKATDKSETGGLSRAISQELSPNLAVVRVRHPAAIFNEYGTSTRGENPTSPYEIKPINVRVLSNFMHRRTNYAPFIAAIVKAHPGMPARPYMRPGKIKGENTLRSLLPLIASRIVKA